jgi:hypothetical protein
MWALIKIIIDIKGVLQSDRNGNLLLFSGIMVSYLDYFVTTAFSNIPCKWTLLILVSVFSS